MAVLLLLTLSRSTRMSAGLGGSHSPSLDAGVPCGRCARGDPCHWERWPSGLHGYRHSGLSPQG